MQRSIVGVGEVLLTMHLCRADHDRVAAVVVVRTIVVVSVRYEIKLQHVLAGRLVDRFGLST